MVACGSGTAQGDPCGDGPAGTGGTRAHDASAGGNSADGGAAANSGSSGATQDASSDSSASGGTSGSAGTQGADGGASDRQDGSVTSIPFECGNRDVTNATVVSGEILEDRTFSGVINVTNNLEIGAAATITIMPGTKFIVTGGGSINIGSYGAQPTIFADGTPEAPIVFCGKAGGGAEAGYQGYWSGLFIKKGVKPESLLRNVLVESAGGMELHAPITLQGVQIRDSAGSGLLASTFGPNSHTLIIKNSGGVPATLLSMEAVNRFPSLSDLRGNRLDRVAIGGPMTEAAHFRNLGVPYLQSGETRATNVSRDDTFTFDPGVVYELGRSAVLDFGIAKVQANGTPAQPVVFRAPCAVDGTCQTEGGYLVIGSEAPGTALVNVRLEALGYYYYVGEGQRARGAIEVNAAAPVTLDGVTFIGPHRRSLVLNGTAGLTPQSRGIRVQRDVGDSSEMEGIVSRSPDNLSTIPADTTFVPGRPTFTVCGAFTRSGTLATFTDAVYNVDCELSVNAGASLTVEPGTEFAFWPYSGSLTFSPGSTGVFVGTADRPIKLNGMHPQPHAWGGVVVRSPNVRMEYVQISSAGPETAPERANVIAFEPLVLRNSVIAQSGGWGLLKRAGDATDYLSTNEFSDNALGAVGTLP